jgi:hypothetical protein
VIIQPTFSLLQQYSSHKHDHQHQTISFHLLLSPHHRIFLGIGVVGIPKLSQLNQKLSQVNQKLLPERSAAPSQVPSKSPSDDLISLLSAPATEASMVHRSTSMTGMPTSAVFAAPTAMAPMQPQSLQNQIPPMNGMMSGMSAPINQMGNRTILNICLIFPQLIYLISFNSSFKCWVYDFVKPETNAGDFTSDLHM